MTADDFNDQNPNEIDVRLDFSVSDDDPGELVYGFPRKVLILGWSREYYDAAVAMEPYVSESVHPSQRVMNLRLLRRYLEKQDRIGDAMEIVAQEGNLVQSTNDPLLIMNTAASIGLAVVRHGSYDQMAKVTSLARVKAVPLMEQLTSPFESVMVSSCGTILRSSAILALLRIKIELVGEERRQLHDLMLREIPELLAVQSYDFLHSLQPGSDPSRDVMPFSVVLAHAEFAAFERTVKAPHHFGLTPEEWLDVARDRALNLTDTSQGFTELDQQRCDWFMFSTLAMCHEGMTDFSTDSFVENARLASIARLELRLTSDPAMKLELELQCRAFEDATGMDWPFCQDAGILSEFF